MKCEKCGKIVNTVILHKNQDICEDCYEEIIRQRDMRSVDELLLEDVVHSLNPEQIVKNFISLMSQYQKEPSIDIWQAMWLIRNWACHEDRTAATTIHEICKWQKFDWWVEREKVKEKKNANSERD